MCVFQQTNRDWKIRKNEVNVARKCRYEVLTLPMSANHISIPTRGEAVSWNRNGLVQWAGGAQVPFVLSCLNTLVNSCQQGGHSAKGQGHLSCVQHIDIVPFYLTPSPFFFPLIPSAFFFSSNYPPPCLPSLSHFSPSSLNLSFSSSSFWWKEWICRELTWLAASYPHDGWCLLHY